MEARQRHRLLWKLIRPAVRISSKLLFNYSAPVCREKGPYLVLVNHNADLDPLLTAYSFPEPLYFVASEHLMRLGRVSDFLRWATDLIPRQKGGAAAGTVLGIVRRLRDGNCVCLYPEGNRSWDGATRPITPATGKLARMAGVKLITYRTEGLYFSNPRWSGGSIRRGKTRGSIVGVYEPEYLKSLSAGDVQGIIERDLYENAYERQRSEHIKFHGKNLAEHLETLLFICPHCKTMHKMKSEGDYFFCTECGARLRYTEDGFFVGEHVIFDTVLDWRIWQNERIVKLCRADSDEPVFRDTGMELYSVSFAENEAEAGRGSLTLYRDRLVLPGGRAVPVKSISGMALMGPQDLYLAFGGESFVVKSHEIRCTSKYLSACKVFDSSIQYGI